MKQLHRTILPVFLILIGLYVLTGCWDRTEIEEIGFVMATGLDPVESKNARGNKPFDFQTTYQVAIPGIVGGEKAVEGEKGFFTIATSSNTNFIQRRYITYETPLRRLIIPVDHNDIRKCRASTRYAARNDYR